MKIEMKKLLTEQETALYLGLSRSTLRQARMGDRPDGHISGIPFIKIGRSVRYSVEDLDKWVDSLEKHTD